MSVVMMKMWALIIIVLITVAPVVLPTFVRVMKALIAVMMLHLHRMTVLSFVPVLRILVRVHDLDLSVGFCSFVCRKQLSQFS